MNIPLSTYHFTFETHVKVKKIGKLDNHVNMLLLFEILKSPFTHNRHGSMQTFLFLFMYTNTPNGNCCLITSKIFFH